MSEVLTFRQKVRLFDSRSRTAKTETLKANYRVLARLAILPPEKAPGEHVDMLKELIFPKGYIKLVESLGTCDPKTRRIADRCLDLWERMDSRVFIGLLNAAFFDEKGNLLPERIDSLFRKFHKALQTALGQKTS